MTTRRTGTPEISAALRVAADGVDVAAEDGAPQQDLGDDGERRRRSPSGR